MILSPVAGKVFSCFSNFLSVKGMFDSTFDDILAAFNKTLSMQWISYEVCVQNGDNVYVN